MNILAISGSTRKHSSNMNLIRAIASLAQDVFSIDVFEKLAEIPHFNPDLNDENPPGEVTSFRRRLQEADGILICTPEYALGVPGTLKNALDWTVSSMEFSKKPVALITASTAGNRAHQSLLGTLLIIESRMTQDSQLVMASVKTKVNDQGLITHAGTLASVQKLVLALEAMIQGQVDPAHYLAPPDMHGSEGHPRSD